MQTWRTLRCNNSLSVDLQQTESLALTSSTGFQRMQHSLYVMIVQMKPVATKLVRCEVTLPVSSVSSEEPLPEVCTVVHCAPKRRNKMPITRQEKNTMCLKICAWHQCNLGNVTFPPTFTFNAFNKLFLLLFFTSSKIASCVGSLQNPTLLPKFIKFYINIRWWKVRWHHRLYMNSLRSKMQEI